MFKRNEIKVQKENGYTLPVSIAAIAAVPAGSTTRPRLNNAATVALISSSLTNMIPLTNFRIWLKAFLPAKGGASPEAILRASGHSTVYPSYNNHIACWLGWTIVCKIFIYWSISIPINPFQLYPHWLEHAIRRFWLDSVYMCMPRGFHVYIRCNTCQQATSTTANQEYIRKSIWLDFSEVF